MTLVLTPVQVSALSIEQSVSDQLHELFKKEEPQPYLPLVVKPPEPPDTPPAPPEPKKHQVVAGDNLTKIAEANGTSWIRLWNKNTDIADPNLIRVDQVILIPLETEQLADRPVPQPVVEQLSRPSAPQTAPRGPVAGNSYSPGYCTWYVKNRRPDLPNNLGNANTWYSRASAQGFAVGSAPRAGAVGWTGRGDLGHVVYVERVNADGSILISEMNYAGLYSQRSRTAAASEFLYIY